MTKYAIIINIINILILQTNHSF